ncbi:MAG TPA: laccase domain-containing protein, partial [Candidatus Saccharimonadales bacterium]|nr:laccase domain-containing protein [Candidatus Saccharimonadales bacterium]
ARAEVIRERLGVDAADVLRPDDAGRIIFDLWAANALQLAQSGVRSIERADLCTQSGGADVWSHRGEAGRNGTGLGVIGLPR